MMKETSGRRARWGWKEPRDARIVGMKGRDDGTEECGVEEYMGMEDKRKGILEASSFSHKPELVSFGSSKWGNKVILDIV